MTNNKRNTGFKDAYGTYICEGDIIKHKHEDNVFEICVWEGFDCYMADCGQPSGNFRLEDLIMDDIDCQNFVIIGNIGDKHSKGYQMLLKQME